MYNVYTYTLPEQEKFAYQSINIFSHSPSAVGLDFAFVGSEHVYGIPQHADTFSLKDTTSTDPYRYSRTVLALPKIYIGIKRYICCHTLLVLPQLKYTTSINLLM